MDTATSSARTRCRGFCPTFVVVGVLALASLVLAPKADAFFYHFKSNDGADCGLVMTLTQRPTGLNATVSASSEATCIPSVGTLQGFAELDSYGIFQVRLNPYPFGCINCGSGSASTTVGGINKGPLRFSTYLFLQAPTPGGVWTSTPSGVVCDGVMTHSLTCLVNETYVIQ